MLSRWTHQLFSLFPVSVVLIFSIDRLTKVWVDQCLEVGEVIPVFPGFNIMLAYNEGAAFSFLSDETGWQQVFFIVLGFIMSGVLMFLMQKTPVSHKTERIGLMLILSGAIGNLYDRIQYGFVVDFIDVYSSNLHWPTFNIADSVICVGSGLFLLGILKK